MKGNDAPEPPIGRYEYVDYTDPTAAFSPYDPRFPAVAAAAKALIQTTMPDGMVEHTGSSAIPGCGGKGVVDLLLLYPPGRLAAARDALDGLGFQRHDKPGAFPEERPVRIGTLSYDGTSFRLHVHVVAEESPEVEEQRQFRERLHADPALVRAYEANKRAVLGAGISDGGSYNAGKESFIQAILGRATDRDQT